ncbi:unnamed protein product [Nezara viridula]|uniref:Uncharacterized protein n=1 Tax=Nezara viridula TaxID=85310 RepID=A0A9P0EA01_NEZVI|nr:unnamed protein product [Nezara viridula]
MGDTFRSLTAEVEGLQVYYEGEEIRRVTRAEAGAFALPSQNLQETGPITGLADSKIQMESGGLALKEVVSATLNRTKTMRRWQRRNRMAEKIILKTHSEARPTLRHSAKDARVIPDPAYKAEESDMRVSAPRTSRVLVVGGRLKL